MFLFKKCLLLLFIFIYLAVLDFIWGFPGGSGGKESACNAGDPGLVFSIFAAAGKLLVAASGI